MVYDIISMLYAIIKGYKRTQYSNKEGHKMHNIIGRRLPPPTIPRQ